MKKWTVYGTNVNFGTGGWPAWTFYTEDGVTEEDIWKRVEEQEGAKQGVMSPYGFIPDYIEVRDTDWITKGE